VAADGDGCPEAADGDGWPAAAGRSVMDIPVEDNRAVQGAAELAGFYQEGYTSDPSRSAEYSRWRALGARGKADHAIRLCTELGLRPAGVLDVGCGDGALLCELRRRGFSERLVGVEIAPAAVEIARGREEIDAVGLYDGRRLPAEDGTYDLGILSHVLEHVPDPVALLAEVARVCRAVVVEVPLEDNLSARRPSGRRHAAEVGHIQRFSRGAVRRIAADAGLRIAGELEDPLPLEVHRFFATTPGARAAATGRWALRSGLHRLSPPTARRLFTVHCACICLTALWEVGGVSASPLLPPRLGRGGRVWWVEF
jgi:SAM-dependent methyltransferase